MKFKKYVFYLALILVSCSEENEKINPTLGTLTESVYASVNIQPAEKYQVFSTVPGIIDRVHVEAGDTVSQNQLLFELVASNVEISNKNAALNADLARENYLGSANMLASLETEIESLKEQLKLDSLNYYRQKRLWEKKIGSLSELENRKLKYDISKRNLLNLQSKLTQSAHQLKTGFKQSQNAVLSAQTNLNDYSIRSRISGRVYEVFKEEGELVTQQTPLALIGTSHTFLINMLIDEVDIAKIALGQSALVTLDAYPDKVFKAEIVKIYPLKDERNQTFTIEARFIEYPKALYAGLSGEANILIGQRPDVIMIPVEYLLDGNKVMTKKGEVTVQVGLRTFDRVEILSGLDTTMQILKP